MASAPSVGPSTVTRCRSGHRTSTSADLQDVIAAPFALAGAHLGRPVVVEGELSERLHRGLGKLATIHQSWFDTSPLDLRADRLVRRSASGASTALAFTSGIDSFHALLTRTAGSRHAAVRQRVRHRGRRPRPLRAGPARHGRGRGRGRVRAGRGAHRPAPAPDVRVDRLGSDPRSRARRNRQRARGARSARDRQLVGGLRARTVGIALPDRSPARDRSIEGRAR